MTFSLVAHDRATGAFGSVICSSSPAVAARCQYVRAGVGAACTQNVTNPALGAAALDALERGSTAAAALEQALRTDPYAGYRQVVVVDGKDAPVVHSGAMSLGVSAAQVGPDCAAAGNLLASPSVISALVSGYLDSPAEAFEERLLDGLAAALLAGGEEGPVYSAGLVVVEDVAWPVTSLRVDWHGAPVNELRVLWKVWRQQKSDYRTRALDPTRAPSYGVPGDL
jgi:uncharacterized Ntn-hydrolase superfamily protein